MTAKILSTLGLGSNFVGTVLVAISIGSAGKGHSYTEGERGHRIDMAWVLRPRQLKWGLLLIGVGFLLQLYAVVFSE